MLRTEQLLLLLSLLTCVTTGDLLPLTGVVSQDESIPGEQRSFHRNIYDCNFQRAISSRTLLIRAAPVELEGCKSGCERLISKYTQYLCMGGTFDKVMGSDGANCNRISCDS